MRADIRDREKKLLMGVVALLVIITGVFGYTGYALHGYLDAMGTMPPAIHFALGHGFKDHVTDLRSSWGDPTGEERYLWFPPFFSLLISAFISKELPIPPPQQALFIAGILAIIAILITSLVLYKVLTLHGKMLDYFGVALISAMLIIVLRSVWIIMARPEVLEGIFLMAGIWLMLVERNIKWLIGGFAVILGFLSATHPFGTLLFLGVVGMYFSFLYEWKQGIRFMSAVCLLGFVVFVLVMQMSPYGLGETFSGIYRHTVLENERINAHVAGLSAIGGFLKSPNALLYGVMMVFVATFCLHFFRRFRSEIKALPLFIMYAIAIACLIGYFVIVGGKTYYALVFSFFIFTVCAYYLAHVALGEKIKYATLLFMGLFAIVSLKPVFAFPFYAREGMTLNEARALFAPIAERYPKAEFFISADSWVLSENYERMHYVADITSEYKSYRPLVILLDQNHSYKEWNPGPIPPSEAEGCPLKENHFVRGTPRILGVPLSTAMPGYGFAVYICE